VSATWATTASLGVSKGRASFAARIRSAKGSRRSSVDRLQKLRYGSPNRGFTFVDFIFQNRHWPSPRMELYLTAGAPASAWNKQPPTDVS
jgi:hypothetical protein